MAPQFISLPIARHRLEVALEKRLALREKTPRGAIRLVHGSADELPGFVIEQFGDVLIAQLFEGQLSIAYETVAELAKQAQRACRASAVYRKWFIRDRTRTSVEIDQEHHNPQPWLGNPASEEYPITEAGCEYLIRPFDGFSVGLFLEQRENRQRVMQAARGKRVLNLFAYTCGFSVAAAKGGATETVSVDMAVRYLEWGKRNFAANNISLDGHWFMRSDVFEYQRRAGRQGREFDLAIIDPPSFSRARRGRGTFVLTDDLNRLVEQTRELLAPEAQILLSTNHRQIGWKQLTEALNQSPGPEIKSLTQLQPPDDFLGDVQYSKTCWAKLG
jgi:23S rRNA (cytosine1962-C5)-methyltransferase